MGSLTDGEPDSASEYPSPASPRSPPAGLSGLSARLMKGMEEDEDDGGPGGRSGDDYYDKMSFGRASVNSDRDRGVGGGGTRMPSGRASVAEDQEKMRREYEYKIATMQTQITTLQRDAGDANEKDRKLKESEARLRQLEDEAGNMRRVSIFPYSSQIVLFLTLGSKRAEEQSSAVRALQKELDDLRESRQREKEQESRRARQDDEELRILRERCETLEQERENGQGGVSQFSHSARQSLNTSEYDRRTRKSLTN